MGRSFCVSGGIGYKDEGCLKSGGRALVCQSPTIQPQQAGMGGKQVVEFIGGSKEISIGGEAIRVGAKWQESDFHCSVGKSVKLAPERQMALVTWDDQTWDEVPIPSVSDWVLSKID